MEKCPYCNSKDIKKISSGITNNEYVCRGCKEKWDKRHAGGHILKATGAVLSGVLVIGSLFIGGDGGDA